MGLLDQLGSAGGMLGGQGQAGGGQAGAMAAIVQMLQSRPGGIAGVLSSFEQGGLGAVAQSWIGGGQNQPVSPDQVSGALGPDAVGDVASRLGVSHEEAAGHLSQLLPQIMDHLSPGGQAPADGGMGGLGGLMAKFGLG